MVDWFAKTSSNGDIENRTLLASAATNKLYSYLMTIPDDRRLNVIKTAYRSSDDILCHQKISKRSKLQVLERQNKEKGDKVSKLNLFKKFAPVQQS